MELLNNWDSKTQLSEITDLASNNIGQASAMVQVLMVQVLCWAKQALELDSLRVKSRFHPLLAAYHWTNYLNFIISVS